LKGSTFRRCDCRDPLTGKQYRTADPKDGERDGRCPKRGRKGHGSWFARYDAPRGADGKRNQVTLGPCATEAEAEAALAAAVNGSNNGAPVSDRRLLFGEYLRSWLSGRADLKPSTLASYTRHVAVFDAAIGHVRLIDLRKEHFGEMYTAMRQIGKPQTGRQSDMSQRLAAVREDAVDARRTPSESTLARYHATAMVALNDAVADERIGRNPGRYIKFGETAAPRAVVWTDERVAEWRRTGKAYPVAVWQASTFGAFLDFAADDDLYALWHLIGMRGLRRGEALGLSWEDCDLERGVITVRRTLTNVGHKPVWGTTKTKAGERTVSLDAGTVDVLRAHRAAQVHRTLRDTNLMFAKVDGEPLNVDGVSQRFVRLVARSGVPPIRLHDLRHVAASLGLAAGVSMKVVSEQLGHSNIAITSDIYSSVSADLALDAAERTAAIVPRAVPATAGSAAVCPPGARLGTNRAVERRASRASMQVGRGGAAGARTQDRRIMSPLL
jgi:integrase